MTYAYDYILTLTPGSPPSLHLRPSHHLRGCHCSTVRTAWRGFCEGSLEAMCTTVPTSVVDSQRRLAAGSSLRSSICSGHYLVAYLQCSIDDARLDYH